MSGTAGVPTQFAAAVTATGQQLDSNFTSVVNYLNDPTNRNNFAVSSGTGTYAVSISPAPGGYTAGLEITFQAGNTNTAAVALNVNGLGVVNMLNQNSSALTVSQIIANGIYKAVHNGTNFIFQAPSGSLPSGVASQGDMEATTANNLYVTPLNIKWAPLVPKGLAVFDATTITAATGLAQFGNIGSVSAAGTGTYFIGFAGSGGFFSSTNYGVICFLDNPTAVVAPIIRKIVRGTDSCVISFSPSTATAAINAGGIVNFVVYGDT